MSPQLFLIIVSLCSALLCGHYASRKGRNVFVWATLGLVFGFLAVVYANFMSSHAEEGAA